MTHQGYSDSSTWSKYIYSHSQITYHFYWQKLIKPIRRQAWGILGFAQTYIWAKDPNFLDAAIRLADYSLTQLSRSPYPSLPAPLWDFDIPTDNDNPQRDSPAGLIAPNGLLILHQILMSDSPYLAAPIAVSNDTIALALSPDRRSLELGKKGRRQ
jgi:hypothetical protein